MFEEVKDHDKRFDILIIPRTLKNIFCMKVIQDWDILVIEDYVSLFRESDIGKHWEEQLKISSDNVYIDNL